MKTQNVEFVEALQILAKAAGITLSSRGGKRQDASQREVWQTAMAESLDFFKAQLTKFSIAKEYCGRRGLDQATLDMWELGYSPDVGDLLATNLKKKGLPLGECRQLFLVDQDAGGGYFDRFRGRLMFAIRDERGGWVSITTSSGTAGWVYGAYLSGAPNPTFVPAVVRRWQDYLSKTAKAAAE